MSQQSILLRVKGKVQGVGFRPFVWQLAQRLKLQGEVSNDAQGVLIALRLPADVAYFCHLLRQECPPLARIDSISEHEWTGGELPDEFCIVESGKGKMDTQIVPDAATCPECLREMSDPDNRRFGYPFINCTHCGPRFTIIHRMPYDRPFTAMANFPLCPTCAQEYQNPANRRFHAQPTACANCGPHLWCSNRAGGQPFTGLQAWKELIDVLLNGGIAAIKGIGGFHLACDASNPQAVQLLRERKRRPAKPLAVMLPDEHWVRAFCRDEVSADLLTLLKSPAAPIVLIPKSSLVLDGIAPGLDEVGVMLPSNPVHHLLLQKIGRPLVMTSGNANGLPPALSNQQALHELTGIADIWLLHNRDIVQRADDSVIRWHTNGSEMLRRSRGFVPDSFDLPEDFRHLPSIAAVGGDLKNTFCLLKGNRAVLSQHLGDLSDERVQQQFTQTWKLLHQIYQFVPDALACDLHPAYASTQLAQRWAEKAALTCFPIQHHHAHLVACMAEHNIALDTPPLVGLALDGIGYGTDDSLWGGECLRVDYRQMQRLGGLPAVALPGGDLAARQPWRNLLAQLLRFVPHWQQYPEAQFILSQPWQILQRAVERNLNSPLASSTGRLFDAAAAALNICAEAISFEGEAACRLEALAQQAKSKNTPVSLPLDEQHNLNMAAFWQQWLSWQAPPEERAYAFHAALAQGLADLVRVHAEAENCRTIVMSGGVLHNRLLRQLLHQNLADFTLLLPQKLPAGDGALALGQAVIAAVQLSDARTIAKT